MTRSKKIFLFISIIFLLLLAIVVWDFSRKTEFRKMGPPQKEELGPQSVEAHQ